MRKMDWSVMAFGLGGGVLLWFVSGLPLVVAIAICLVAWLLHPVVKIGYRLFFTIFGDPQTKLFFSLARAARRDDIARDKFAALAALYEIDPKREGIEEVRHYRRLIEDMNAHLARFPEPKQALKSVYLRRCLRDICRNADVDPTSATRQFDMAMAEAHAPEYKRPTDRLRRLTTRMFDRAFGSVTAR